MFIFFSYGQASAVLKPIMPGGVCTLMNVWSINRGKGEGRGVLQKVVDYADEHDLTIMLVARRYGNPNLGGMSNKELQAFYGKFGFEKDSDPDFPLSMIRRPRIKNT